MNLLVIPSRLSQLLKVFPAICQIVHCFYNLSGVSVLIIKVATAKQNMQQLTSAKQGTNEIDATLQFLFSNTAQ